MDIIHPYGTVGSIFSASTPTVPFGSELRADTIVELSNGIRTYTERIEDEAFLRKIATPLEQARTIVFLGFGYHVDNMRILTLADKSEIHQLSMLRQC